MSNHTSGPWIVGEPSTRSLGGFKVNAYSISAHGTAIACVFAGSVGGNRIMPNTEGLPNAQLIAAAPDLAERLRDIVHAYESGSASALQVWITDTRALLAKAGVQS